MPYSLRGWIAVACFSAALGAADTASAQNSVVRGVVVDEKGDPVAGATVTFNDQDEELSFEAETGKDGSYNIVLRPGRYEILIGKDGYRGARLERRFRRSDGIDMETIDITSTASLMEDLVAGLNERFAEAARLAGEGKLDEAQAVFEGLLEERPELVDVRYNLGLLFLQKEETDNAEKAFRETLEQRPDHAGAAVQLATIYEDTGRSEEAAPLLEKVIAQNPDDAGLLLQVAYVHLTADRHDQAEPLLERVVELQPEGAEAHYLLATVLARKGEFDRAIGLLQRFGELAPADDRYRAQAETMLKQLEEIRAAQQASESGP